MFERISQNVIFTIREELYTRLHQLDFSTYDRTKVGDVMARMTGDLEAVSQRGNEMCQFIKVKGQN
ncbi:ABC transporter transmembrane domain-containing protein [Bacillus sp. X1(2014)]|uniref:ABC transporter transmembrane domain-containing protein n=1 Tax=Bacillus sp. X1(2014) TaxID=1565991 RepID=UPI0011A6924A|nr:ABC transporter transmembrane domain-containing protein [Bacillus sp. X1(2014)]